MDLNEMTYEELVSMIGGLHSQDKVKEAYKRILRHLFLTREDLVSDMVLICLEMKKYADPDLVFIPLRPEQTVSIFLIHKKKPVLSAAVRAFLTFAAETGSAS